MPKKVFTIKNVGRFRNSAAPGNPHFAKHTFITGANGYPRAQRVLKHLPHAIEQGEGSSASACS